ncbi:hypothetical protein NKR23_g4189 [Pleurostoma richardsiae]|uniref:Uncharacterized protein n=1 Tax=Pleurostoma richardsiae TaxID=41990 RepID=A0AA38RX35_9PEZI|nr:hypothetical protein NKR23_g4189 [Pleurostoma richardsiae]
MSNLEMDDDLPPPYSPPSAAANTTSFSPDLYTAHLASHLSTLPSRIRATQEQHTSQQARSDLDLITLLVPHVEAFLSDLAAATSPTSSSSSSARPAAELTLVPERAVPRAWALAGARERQREGEVVQLVRVAPPPAGKGDDRVGGDEKTAESSRTATRGGSASGQEPSSLRERIGADFDEWGRWDDDAGSGSGSGDTGPESWWWWRDEAMARRLAAYLQPRRPEPTPRLERRQVQAAVEKAREERKSSSKGWGMGWGRKKSVASASDSGGGSPARTITPLPSKAEEAATRGGGTADDGVTMTVRAEEVSFRRENEFGVWESMSGWGLVVTVRIRR